MHLQGQDLHTNGLRCQSLSLVPYSFRSIEALGLTYHDNHMFSAPYLPPCFCDAGLPLVERVRVYGRELHSGRFLVKGNYSGGVEGESTFQWYRAIAGSWQLTPIPG